MKHGVAYWSIAFVLFILGAIEMRSARDKRVPIGADERTAQAEHLACVLGKVDDAIETIRSIATQAAREIEEELLTLEAAITDALSQVKDDSQYDKASIDRLVESAAALFLRVNDALPPSRTAKPPKTDDSPQGTITGIVVQPEATLPVTAQPATAHRDDPLLNPYWRMLTWLLHVGSSSGGNRNSGGADALNVESSWYPRDVPGDVPGDDQSGIEIPLDLGSTVDSWTDTANTDTGGGLFDIDFGSGSDDTWS